MRVVVSLRVRASARAAASLSRFHLRPVSVQVQVPRHHSLPATRKARVRARLPVRAEVSRDLLRHPVAHPVQRVRRPVSLLQLPRASQSQPRNRPARRNLRVSLLVHQSPSASRPVSRLRRLPQLPLRSASARRSAPRIPPARVVHCHELSMLTSCRVSRRLRSCHASPEPCLRREWHPYNSQLTTDSYRSTLYSYETRSKGYSYLLPCKSAG